MKRSYKGIIFDLKNFRNGVAIDVKQGFTILGNYGSLVGHITNLELGEKFRKIGCLRQNVLK